MGPGTDPRAHAPGGAVAAALASLAAGTHGDPFALLGPHRMHDGRVWVRVLLPGARQVQVVDDAGDEAGALAPEHPAGLFAGPTALDDAASAYRLRASGDGGTIELEDPYRFGSQLGAQDLWYLAEGTHQRLWTVLGAHPCTVDGVAGVRFAVWAPNARSCAVIGDFNAWDPRRHPMRRHLQCGVWELFVPGAAPGARYKYCLHDARGVRLPDKADPLAFAAELRPRTASVVASVPAPRAAVGTTRNRADAPIAIYEVHAGSWRRGADNRFLHWDALAEQLAAYVSELGFTHIELLPVNEHPFDGSWGYQPTALYAPSARFGGARDFQAFVARLQQQGVGVIVDWVPAHFPADAHGLARFDGTCLYEHADPRRGRHPDWGTLIYNLGRREVRNYLLANALYWLETFGVDGLRVDAVASMLYLDYSRGAGEWLPNRYGGHENLEAVAFLREVNALVRERFPDCLMIAEESTAWPGVTAPPAAGGLGFHFKWNMGWMNDTLRHLARDPVHRRFHHDELTFGFSYAQSERFILPLSHDEVVHGKGALLAKMPGALPQRFASLRAYLAFMYAHPGKKLLFMGNELAQKREWNHDRALDWGLLGEPAHAGVQRLVQDLNRLYRTLPALHAGDCDAAGFRWISGADAEHSVVAFMRLAPHDDALLVAVTHLTPLLRHDYRLGVPRAGFYRECMNSDAAVYGGSDTGNLGGVEAQTRPAHGFAHSIGVTLPPLTTLMFTWQPHA